MYLTKEKVEVIVKSGFNSAEEFIASLPKPESDILTAEDMAEIKDYYASKKIEDPIKTARTNKRTSIANEPKLSSEVVLLMSAARTPKAEDKVFNGVSCPTSIHISYMQADGSIGQSVVRLNASEKTGNGRFDLINTLLQATERYVTLSYFQHLAGITTFFVEEEGLFLHDGDSKEINSAITLADKVGEKAFEMQSKVAARKATLAMQERALIANPSLNGM